MKIFKFSIITISLIFLLVSTIKYVDAEGGKSKECTDADVRGFHNGDSKTSYEADDDKEIEGVCIKSGVNMFDDGHSGKITDNGEYEDACYKVSGIGTDSLTVKKLFDGRECQDLSHLDIYLTDKDDGDDDDDDDDRDDDRDDDDDDDDDRDDDRDDDDDDDDDRDDDDDDVLGALNELPKTGPTSALSILGFVFTGLGSLIKLSKYRFLRS
jgi:LPXTG-motif cell wall-anchored protein